MRKVLPSCQTIFDVGANIGLWSLKALEINPSLNIHCFEPSQSIFNRLLSQPFPKSVIQNNFGLSAVPGEQTLYMFKDRIGLSSLYRRDGLEEKQTDAASEYSEEIHLDTLERYCAQNEVSSIDFLKLDVEGHELEVLKGSLEMLKSSCIKIIQFEYGGCNID
jgi:FkbM family methyltransferase